MTLPGVYSGLVIITITILCKLYVNVTDPHYVDLAVVKYSTLVNHYSALSVIGRCSSLGAC